MNCNSTQQQYQSQRFILCFDECLGFPAAATCQKQQLSAPSSSYTEEPSFYTERIDPLSTYKLVYYNKMPSQPPHFLLLFFLAIPALQQPCDTLTCAACDPVGSSVCVDCIKGYFLNQGVCFPLPRASTSGFEVVYAVSIVLSAVALVLLGVLIYCCWRKRQGQRWREEEKIAISAIRLGRELRDWSPYPSREVIEKETCAICLAGGLNVETSCGHFFHHECLLMWSLQHRRTCPFCRTKYDVVVNLVCGECSSWSREVGLVEIDNMEEKKCERCVERMLLQICAMEEG